MSYYLTLLPFCFRVGSCCAARIVVLLIAIVIQQATAVETSVKTLRSPEQSAPVRVLRSAKTGSTQDLYVIADTSHGPKLWKSVDDGKSFSDSTPLVDSKKQPAGLEYHVWDAAISPDGNLYIALGTNAWKLKLPKEEWGYFLVIYNTATNEVQSIRNINKTPSEGFSVAVNEKGDVAICWLADELFWKVSRDGGKTFGETMKADSGINPCNCCTTSCTFLENEKLGIFYREETNNNRDMYLAQVDLKTNAATKSRISKTPWKIDTCPMTYYSIHRTRSGLQVIWPTQRQVFLAALDESGRLKTPGEVQSIGLSGMRTGMTTVSNQRQQTLAVWNSDNRISWQVFDEKMQPTSETGSVETTGKGVAAFVDSNDGFVVLH